MAHFTPSRPFCAAYLTPIPPHANLYEFDGSNKHNDGMIVHSETLEPPAPCRFPGPIYGLSADILFSIFALGTSCDEHGGNFPVIVSQVCRFWRKLALQNPLLWTKIRIGCSKLPPMGPLTGPLLPRASSFVIRSGQCPLDIKLNFSVVHSRPSLLERDLALYFRLVTHASVDLLASVHGRVRSLQVISDTEDITLFLSHKLLPLGMPLLESWTMGRGDPMRCLSVSPPVNPPQRFIEFDTSGQRGGWLGLEDHLRPITELLPRLRILQFSRTLASWSSWLISGLTSLTINHLPLNQRPPLLQLRYILKMNRDTLEVLELHGSLPRHWVADLYPISLPKLRHLRLGYLIQDEAVVILQNLEMPALQSLSLCDISTTVHRCRHSLSRMMDGIPINIIYPIPVEEELDSGYLFHFLHDSCQPLMANLQSLELINVRIFSAQEEFIEGEFPQAILPNHICAVQLLMCMTSLKTLTLDSPDPTLLHCLNQPVTIRSADKNVEPRKFYPGSGLLTLCIFNAEYDDLVDFLSNRTDVAFHVGDEFPKLPRLEFTLEQEEEEMFDSECYSEEGPVMLPWLTKCAAARIHPKVSFL